MLPDQHLEELRKIHLFGQLDAAKLREVAEHAKLIQLSTGDVLFSQDHGCEHFYMVRSGMIKLFRISADGAEKVLELITANQVFAEDAMFVGRYSTYADALEPTELIAFDCGFFAALLGENTELCLRMMTLMSQRSRNLVDEIGSLTLQNAFQRVTQYLVKAKGSLGGIAGSVRLNSHKHVIASRLGVTPETFSRIITKLRNEGMIDCSKNTIMLKNETSLRQVADGMICLKV